MISMKELPWGVEIETVGATRQTVATAIRSVVGGTVRHIGVPYPYDPHEVTDAKGRVWRVVADSSLGVDKSLQAEIVSPILEYQDLPELQEVIRAVRRAGGGVSPACGLHIHISSAKFDAKAVANFIKTINKQEELIAHALGISPARRSRYCKPIDQDFVAKLEKRRPRTMEQINKLWYGRYNANPERLHPSRYFGININSVYYRGSLEIRWFQLGEHLHAGKVKAYLQFVLALAARGLNARASSAKKREFNPATAKYDLRVFMISALKLNGPEFKTCRQHMLALLDGNSAWKHGRPFVKAAA